MPQKTISKLKKVIKELSPQSEYGGEIELTFNSKGVGFVGIVCCGCSLVHEVVALKNKDGSVSLFWYPDDLCTDLLRGTKELIPEEKIEE